MTPGGAVRRGDRISPPGNPKFGVALDWDYGGALVREDMRMVAVVREADGSNWQRRWRWSLAASRDCPRWCSANTGAEAAS